MRTKKYIVRFQTAWFLPFDDEYFKKTFESDRYKIIKEISKYIIKFNEEHVFQKYMVLKLLKENYKSEKNGAI